MMSTLDELAVEIREINRANGWDLVNEDDWYKTDKIPAILALVHSEVSEALEGFRDRDQENFLEEMADTLIRVLDCVGGMTPDFDSIVRKKMAFNRTRGYRQSLSENLRN